MLVGDIQAAAEGRDGRGCAIIAALVAGDRTAPYDEVALASRVHTTAVAAAFICVIADLAAVHGEVSLNRIGVSYTYTGTTAKITSRTIYECVVADLAAVHGERAAVYIYTPVGVAADLTAVHGKRAFVYLNTAIVPADRAAVHGEGSAAVYIDAFATGKAAIRIFRVGNSSIILPAALAVAEDKRSINTNRVTSSICERMAVQA